ncbi:MAG: polysaccharide deacetylase family protein [Clostridium sp.]|jgi:chitooligosaccharide deacetylase|nr:polysaccharide deacetylase family protein [Clostridium sp.]
MKSKNISRVERAKKAQKKRIYVIISTILIFLLCITIYLYTSFDSYKSMGIMYNEISAINITSMPSPPNNIKLDNIDEIKEFINTLNKVKLKRIENKEKENGWIYTVKLSGNKEYVLQISSKNEIIINDEKYKTENIELLKNYIKGLIEKDSSSIETESVTNGNENNREETSSANASTTVAENHSVDENKDNNEINNDNKTNIEEEGNDKPKYSYGKYTISKSDASTENIGFWFGRNKDFKRPEAPLTIEDFKKYNAYYLGEDEKVIYLTFDEGLNNTQAEKNLDTLKKHNIKGTFFVTKGFIEANTDIVKRMVNEGHVVGNHTYNHPNMAQTAEENPEQFIKELAITEDTFKNLVGTEMDKVLRFPEGTFSECAMDYANEMGYKCIFWSFAYKDWNAEWNDKDYALDWMKTYSHNGAIYLLHGVNKANADALDEFITYMDSEGYRFDVVTNLN